MSLVAQYVEGDFPCAITKSEALGTLCGYIGVPKCHPWYGQEYSDLNVDVHCGLTYGDHEMLGHPLTLAYLEKKCAASPRNLAICQRLLDVERKNAGKPRDYPHATGLDIWWFGFDCAHLGDLTPGPDNPKPGTEHLYPLGEGWYKDEAYVRQEIAGLVRQAAKAMNAVQGQPA